MEMKVGSIVIVLLVLLLALGLWDWLIKPILGPMLAGSGKTNAIPVEMGVAA